MSDHAAKTSDNATFDDARKFFLANLDEAYQKLRKAVADPGCVRLDDRTFDAAFGSLRNFCEVAIRVNDVAKMVEGAQQKLRQQKEKGAG